MNSTYLPKDPVFPGWFPFHRGTDQEDNHIRFDETRINNDTTFSYLVGHLCKSIAVDKRAIYNYMVRFGSTSRQKDIERFYIKIDVFSMLPFSFKG